MGKPSRVRVTGAMAPYASGFRKNLGRQGYKPNAASNQLQLMAHVSRWLDDQQLAVGDLTSGQIEEFLKARRAEGYTLWLSTRGMDPLVDYLRGLGAVPKPELIFPKTPAEQLLAEYEAYLLEERGLASSTTQSYMDVARLFFSKLLSAGNLDLEHLAADEVTQFMLEECKGRSVGWAKYLVCGLRALLRFVYVEGHIDNQLANAIPSVAGWRMAGLPKALDQREVGALLENCDRRTAWGRRDFAILKILVRLGLRAGEVAGLELDDIDWRAGEVIIKGKGRREERLPLPDDVGNALASWLRRGRPRCECRNVFTRVRAPHRGLSTPGVSAVVVAACKRAGLREVRAHRLRHTAATEMVRAGAGFDEVGQVLRHRSILTTAIYGKVDRPALSKLALPWPGGAQ